MSGTGILIVLAGLIVFGASIWGLFNRKRSVFCAVAGLLVLLGAGLGGWHAWNEARSVTWTTGYLVVALIGIVSIVRQIKPRKP